MEQASVFLQALEAIPEGDGTLLDNCAIVLSSEVSEGRSHSLDEYPLLLAGSAGGDIATKYALPFLQQRKCQSFTLFSIAGYGSQLGVVWTR